MPATLLTLALCACAHESTTARPVVLSSALPSIYDTSLQNRPLDKSKLAGKVVMVIFISTWCFPCLADLPILKKLQEELGPEGYETIAIGMDLEGTKVLRPFVQQYDFPYPVVLASDEIRNGESVFGRIRELPTRFIFARDGSLAIAFSGNADPQQLIDAVTAQVKGTAPKAEKR